VEVFEKDITSWCKECQQCCRNKMTTQPSAVIATLALPGQFLIAEEPLLPVFVEWIRSASPSPETKEAFICRDGSQDYRCLDVLYMSAMVELFIPWSHSARDHNGF